MTGNRLDDLARALATRRPRRRLLGLLTGAPLAVTLLRGGRDVSARVCRELGEPCDDRVRCCRDTVCRDARCVCRPGLTDRCDGTCRDLASDAAHCGECGHACDADETCCGGACCPIGPPFGCCDGECINVNRSDEHCGGCGQRCPDDLTCCVGRCRDLQRDERFCGTCDTSCARGQGICREGVCWCKPRWDCGGPSNRCGERPGGRCRTGEECCSGFCLSPSRQPGDRECAPCRGISCESDAECCDGFKCIETSEDSYCGGCIAAPLDHPCDPTRAECCFADCSANPGKPNELRCLSQQGGRCARDIDCWACRLDVGGASCPGTCIDGRCVR
jgi:hypothetical protein